MKIKVEDKYFKLGLTIFFAFTACIIVFFAISRFDVVKDIVGAVWKILTPFVYGLVFAYLLCPFYNMMTRNMYAVINRKAEKPKRALSFSKGTATFVSLIMFFVVLIGIGWMIIPGLIDSITHVVEVLPAGIEQLLALIEEKTVNYPHVQETLENWVNRFYGNVLTYIEETMIPNYMDVATSISTGVFSILNVVKNFFIGVIVMAYFLNIKDTFAAQSKKLIMALCTEERAAEILEGAKFTNKTFGGFISGKLIDSAIIGILCFICMTIFGWEYPLLISCIVGLTNIIPFFGPFIGAVPSALLLLMVNPMQCLYFLIFILILQQLDGNVIGPKILGDSTGLASFWVLFAILVGGGLFGFAGMIIGIPLFAVFYAYFSRAVNRRLGKKGFSTDLKDYTIDKYRVRPKKQLKNNKEGIIDENINK